jgi:hypothetical protein
MTKRPPVRGRGKEPKPPKSTTELRHEAGHAIGHFFVSAVVIAVAWVIKTFADGLDPVPKWSIYAADMVMAASFTLRRFGELPIIWVELWSDFQYRREWHRQKLALLKKDGADL